MTAIIPTAGWSADSDLTADNGLVTADGGHRSVPSSWPSGWPCALLDATPPLVDDALTAPTGAGLTPQVLANAPRGAAWGTDEAGDGSGASPVQRRFWSALAGWSADLYVAAGAAVQAFPSAITWSLDDWEREYGLPDPCLSGVAGTDARIAAVRSRFGAIGGSSPAYFVCLAASLGYDVTIEEPTQFLVDTSECIGAGLGEAWFHCDDGELDDEPLERFTFDASPDDGDGVAGGIIEDWFLCDDGVVDETPIEAAAQDPAGSLWKSWVVHVDALGESWFRVDEGVIDADRLEAFLPASDLECLMRRHAPPHTELLFAYAA